MKLKKGNLNEVRGTLLVVLTAIISGFAIVINKEMRRQDLVWVVL